MGYRHRARERAVQALYEWDSTGRALELLLERFWRAHPEEEPRVRRFAEHLVYGTVERVAEIDPLIVQQADNWRLDRIARVDLGILRLGAYELLAESDTPPAVAIDEAIELAKRYSGEQAGQFVNGVLDGIRQRLGRAEVHGASEGPGEETS